MLIDVNLSFALAQIIMGKVPRLIKSQQEFLKILIAKIFTNNLTFDLILIIGLL